MKNTLLVAVLLAVGCAVSSQAVVIHWAVTTPLEGLTSAALVYVSNGANAPTWSGSAIEGGTQIGDTAEALPSYTVGAQASVDATATQAGGYYVVLFKGSEFSVSTSWLSYNDLINGLGSSINAMTADAFSPAGGLFDPVPEPSTAALLCLGAAAAALRRRKRV